MKKSLLKTFVIAFIIGTALLSAYYAERNRLGRDISQAEKDVIRARVIIEIDEEAGEAQKPKE